MIRKGDTVTIKPEWQDAGDAKFTWVARNDEEMGRVDISALELSHMRIWPMHTVCTNMLQTKDQ
jgi:hypothetical protein